jgi:hypothetical protein
MAAVTESMHRWSLEDDPAAARVWGEEPINASNLNQRRVARPIAAP